VIRRLGVVEGQALHHRVASEFRAQPVDRVFSLGGAPVDQIGEIATYGVFQVADADADKAETRGTHFVREQVAAGRKYA